MSPNVRSAARVQRRTSRHQRVLSLEMLEERTLLATQAVTLADSSFWGASAAGISGNHSSFSSDSQLIAFESDAGNLTADDFNGLQDIFVRDVASGATVLVIATPGGTSGSGASFNPILSADGRFVLFESDASDLVAGDTNSRRDVFRRDLQNGATTLVSVGVNGAAANNNSFANAISSDGQRAVFASAATNLVSLPTSNQRNVFVRDFVAGTTTLVSVNLNNTGGGNSTSAGTNSAVLSQNGRFVAFDSLATDLVDNDLNGIFSDVFVRDLNLQTTSIVSINQQSTGTGNHQSTHPVFDVTGQLIAFESKAQDISPNPPTGFPHNDVYVRNLVSATTERVSVDNTFDNTPPQDSVRPVFSPNGRFVAYEGKLNDLTTEIYARDLMDNTTLLVSANRFSDASADHISDGHSSQPVFSPDGQKAYFASTGTILVGGATSGVSQIYARNLSAKTTSVVSIQTAGSAGDGASTRPVLSNDGMRLAFQSQSTGLVAGDNNALQDVFVLDVAAATIGLASPRSPTLPPEYTSRTITTDQRQPTGMSDNGRFVVFTSDAKDLVTNAVVTKNVYRHDRQSGQTELVSVNPDGTGGIPGAGVSGPPAISADGRFVVFSSSVLNLVSGLQLESGSNAGFFMRDMELGTTRAISVNAAGRLAGGVGERFTISPNGRYAAFATNKPLLAADANTFTDVYVYDLQMDSLHLASLTPGGVAGNNHSNVLASTAVGAGHNIFSTDGRYLTFTSSATDLTAAGGANEALYVRDLQDGITTLVSVKENGMPATTFGHAMSGDGNRVVIVTNVPLTASDTNSQFDIYVRDVAASTTTHVTAGQAFGGDTPTISRDGQRVLYSSGVSLNLVLHELAAGTETTVHDGSELSYLAAFSGDAEFIAFLSTDVSPSGTTSTSDLFLYDVQAQTATLVNINQAGTGPSNRGVLFARPAINDTGSVVAYASDSFDLIGSDTNGRTDIFAFTRSLGGGSLSGEVFDDTNGDGDRDGDEGPRQGWMVFIDENGNGTRETDEDQAFTDANGEYAFLGLVPGDYRVAAEQRAGFTQTAPPAGFFDRTIVADESIGDLDFGFRQDFADLFVQSIDLPATGVPGQNITIDWMVANQGTLDAAGSWQDAVYLSRDATLDASDVLLGTVPHSGGLDIGSMYPGSLTALLPAVLPGDYFVLVETDRRGQVLQADRTNDVLASTTTIALDVPELFIDVDRAGTLGGAGDRQYFKITPPAGRSLEIMLDSLATSGATAVYIRRGSLPTPGTFDIRGQSFEPDARLIVPQTVDQSTYFILVEGQFGDAATAGFTLTAHLPGLTIAQISPNQGGNTGRVTVRIDGTELTPTTTVQLFRDTTTLDAVSIDFRDATHLFATFDLDAAPIASYHLFVFDGPANDLELDVFQVVAGVDMPLKLDLIVPSSFRPGRQTPFVVEVQNTGNTDVSVPVLQVSSDMATIRLAEQTGVGSATQIFFAASPDGPAGVLRPGQTSRIVLSFLSADTAGQGAIVPFDLEIPAPLDAAVDWSVVRDAARPLFTPTDAWDVIYGRFQAAMGTTFRDVEARLGADASFLSELGVRTVDPGRLSQLALQEANNLLPGVTFVQAVDADVATPGIGLGFERIFLQPISGRYRLGALGRGWTHNWEISASTDTQGNVGIESRGVTRFFSRQSNGSYRVQPGDAGQLQLIGGAFQLREANGLRIQFFANGKFEFVEDAQGNRITAAYDGAGLLSTLTHSSGAALTFGYDGNARLVSVADQTGRTSTYSYDGSGEHLSSATTIDGTTEYAYVSGQGAASEHAIASISFVDGTHQFFEYDSGGRLVHAESDDGAEPLTFSYPRAGEMTIMDATGAGTTFRFNDAARPVQVRDALGRTTSLDYDLNHFLTRLTTAAGTNFAYRFNPQGSLLSAIDPLGGTVQASYDPMFQQLTTLSDARGNTVNYTIDGASNITDVVYADASRELFRHDAVGNVIESTDAGGQSIDYAYADNGEPVSKVFDDGSRQDVTFDEHDNLLTATDGAGTITMQYDDADRLTRIDHPGGQFLAYTYDANGRRGSVNQNGFVVNYAYDSAGRLSDLTDESGGTLVHYEYDSRGDLATKRLGNQTVTTYEYDEARQLLHLVNHAADGSVNSRFDYSYDSLGHRTSATTLDGTTSYGYDLLGQLTSVRLPGGRTIQYEYAAAGNRVKVIDDGVETAYAADELNRTTSVGATTFTYDANGNLQTRTDSSGTTTYTFNALNQLTSIVGPSGTIAYEYDPFGNKRSETVNGLRREFLFDPLGLGDLVAEFDDQGNPIATYVHGIGLIGQLVATDAFFFDFDGVGSTVGVSNDGGTYVNQYAYLPFGETTVLQETVTNPFRYVGEFGVQDRGTGLLDMRFRHYDPATGQFISDDPTGIAAGDANFRRYASNDPTGRIDPLGLDDGTVATNAAANAAVTDGGYGSTYNSRTGNIAIQTFEHPEGCRVTVKQYKKIVKYDILWSRWIETGEGLRATGAWVNRVRGLSATREYEAAQIAAMRTFSAGKLVVRVVITFIPIFDVVDTYCGANEIMKKAYEEASRRPPPFKIRVQKKYAIGEESLDPNDIVGPSGFGPQHFTTADHVFPYTVHFENDPNRATAAAQEVFVTQQLDADLDWTTFELGDVGFGSMVVTVPAGLKEFHTQVDYQNQDGSPLLVNADAQFDVASGLVSWTFRSIDPATGELPIGAFDGFLPVDDATGRGEGFINYFVRPKTGLTTGTTIDAQASIVFDINAPLLTNLFTNTIDAGPPSSTVDPLPAVTTTGTFNVSWSGTDDADGTFGSGIASFDVFVSDSPGAAGFTRWLHDTTATSAIFTGQSGHAYGFFSVATDNVGHRQPAPFGAQSTTTVSLDTVGPTISDIRPVTRLVGRKVQIIGLDLVFNEAIESTEAADKTNYTITGPPSGTRPGAPIGLASAAYDSIAHVVRLTAFRAFKLPKPVQVSADNAIQDLFGNPLGGEPGDPGEDYVARVSVGTKATFTEADGDKATLTLAGGGTLRFIERNDGSQRDLHLIGTVAGRSTLSGIVTRSRNGAADGRATLTLLTVEPGHRFRSTLANPPLRIGPLAQTAIDELLAASGGTLAGVLFT